MAAKFKHEKLVVYDKALGFVAWRVELLRSLPCNLSACDHLERATESILLNIAHGSATWSPRERIVYLGHANGSALECAACLDVFVARSCLSVSEIHEGKCQLREIVNMLMALKKNADQKIQEPSPNYETSSQAFFSHETLSVYQHALQFVRWLEQQKDHFSCSEDLLSKLDKSSTAIALNIAEGNGRFTGKDKAKFLRIAYKATIQSASLVDIAAVSSSGVADRADEAKEILSAITAMLTALEKAVTSSP